MKKTYLSDYREPAYRVENIYLEFQLDRENSIVNSRMSVEKLRDEPLTLNYENMRIESLKVDGVETHYKTSNNLIEIDIEGKNAVIEIENSINPKENSELQGLYQSGDILCTQNEPEGFRRITPFIDRPDVMTKYTTKLIGDIEDFPILLSNGNPIDSGELPNGKHYVVWEDPFPKPSYLYAVVAGKLDLLQDEYTTVSGRKIDLRIYTDLGKSEQATFAMESLKSSMIWDEDKYGLEYDLDIYMIVAVDSFNSGAMENKGLNIFNSAYILADEKKSTDADYLAIESVVAHEYFHNWTGNRITCRDWFQLTLKEGLTVFRDQQFSADMRNETLQRINDVERLKSYQFVEDSSPNAHPIKPKEYIEINNFYTFTVYEKGSEVIRMLHTMLREEGFRKGMDLYFERHDGQAVTTEDFLSAMADANKIDLSEFSKWYDIAGTPEVEIDSHYENDFFSLTVTSSTEAMFPLKVTLYGENGLILGAKTLKIHKPKEKFLFTSRERPVFSINQNFSAPVKVKYNYSNEELLFLLKHDFDLFNRYEVAQKLHLEAIRKGVTENYLKAIKTILDSDIELFLKSAMLRLPTITTLFGEYDKELPIEFLYSSIDALKERVATTFTAELFQLLQSCNGTSADELTDEALGMRDLKGVLLDYISYLEDSEKSIFESYNTSNTMTEKLKILSLLSGIYRDEVEKDYIDEFGDDQEMVVKYFRHISSDTKSDPLNRVKQTLRGELYSSDIPNLVRGLLGSFSRNYRFFFKPDSLKLFRIEVEKLDAKNPQLTSRLLDTLNLYPKLDRDTKKLIEDEFKEFYKSDRISKNSFEKLQNIFK